MDQTTIKMVQGQIGYTFRNPDLLRQAFTRRSFAQENGGEDNEVLEFIGDKALDLAVVQLLIRKFGSMSDGSPAAPTKPPLKTSLDWFVPGTVKPAAIEFVCSCNEGELTSIKSRMVQKSYLSRRVEELGFARHIIMGKGDCRNNAGNEASVKEDLFEAIIGAVTLDCGWDFSQISSVVDAMLCFDDFLVNDTEDNYVRLIQEWEEDVNHTLPYYWFHEKHGSPLCFDMFAIPSKKGTVFQTPPTYGDEYNYSCDLKLLDDLPLFRGWGASKGEARMNVCKLAYQHLIGKGLIRLSGIRDEIDEPTRAFAINQLEILSRRGYFPLPTYSFRMEHDKDGNPIWQCSCSIAGYKPQHGEKSSSKKDAKKSAALKALLHVLDDYDQQSKEEENK